MNAIVEVTTAEVVVETGEVVVFTTTNNYAKVSAPVVVTSTAHVPSIAGTSISAVSPDYIFREELALAGV